MSFHQSCRKFLEDEGYSYLGEESGLVFYKDYNGRVWGSSESSVLELMKQRGYFKEENTNG